MNEKALSEAAMQIAGRGFSEYIRVHKLEFDHHYAGECLKGQVSEALPQALADAKEAFECGMTQAGVATFTASMVNAGIEAAMILGRKPVPDGAVYQPGTGCLVKEGSIL